MSSNGIPAITTSDERARLRALSWTLNTVEVHSHSLGSNALQVTEHWGLEGKAAVAIYATYRRSGLELGLEPWLPDSRMIGQAEGTPEEIAEFLIELV